jgi:hypothetical protein
VVVPTVIGVPVGVLAVTVPVGETTTGIVTGTDVVPPRLSVIGTFCVVPFAGTLAVLSVIEHVATVITWPAVNGAGGFAPIVKMHEPKVTVAFAVPPGTVIAAVVLVPDVENVNETGELARAGDSAAPLGRLNVFPAATATVDDVTLVVTFDVATLTGAVVSLSQAAATSATVAKAATAHLGRRERALKPRMRILRNRVVLRAWSGASV